jgi:hypothetical protein
MPPPPTSDPGARRFRRREEHHMRIFETAATGMVALAAQILVVATAVL